MGIDILLKKFVDVLGISGSEDDVKKLMKKELKGHVDKIYEDKVGSVISVKGKGKIKVLLTAHMDEIGFMIKNITDSGYLKLNSIGGWDSKILLSKKVRVYTDKGVLNGVIGSKAPHMQEKDETERAPKLKQIFVDIGANDKNDAKKIGVKIGDYIEVVGDFIKLKNNKVVGRCFDNRISCAVLTEVMKKVKPKGFTLYGAGSVQEEIGLKGAESVMYGINPDIIISLDVCFGEDPYIKGDVPVELGKGVSIGLQDSCYVIHKQIKKMLIDTAKKNKIPYQLVVSSGGTTEATRAILTREGKPGGLISVPVRYMHTTVETADVNDMENAVKLLVKSLENVNKYF